MRRLATCLAVLIFVFMAPVALQAQTKGSLTGTVTDPAGAVVPGANVTLKSNSTGAARTVTTADNGGFNFTEIDPGMYTVAVEITGFKRAVANNIEINVATPAQVSIALEAGQVSETVTVTGAQDVVNTSSPSLTNVINTRQVNDLPLPTRNPLDLAGLQAGIAVVGNDVRGSSVAGLRQTATNVTQDGINAMDNFVKTSSFFAINAPSLNSTSEFSITTGTVGSEAGRGVGQVNVVTKGGSNQFHGGVFYLHRNDALNATRWFNNYNGTPKDVLRQHFFGLDIGGPIYFPNFGDGGPKIFNGKDTAFFFFSYEGFRENFQATRNRTVLTQNARQGLFTYTGTDGVTRTLDLLALGGRGVNSATATLLSQAPLPNNTSCAGQDGFNIACYQFTVTGTDPNDKYVARYDHQLVKDSSYGSHKFEFVLNRAHFLLTPDTFNVIESPLPGGINAFQESKRWLVTGALVSNFGSSVTNVFRYGRQWAPVLFLLDSSPTTPIFVFPALPGVTPATNLTSPVNSFVSQGRNTTVDQYKNDVSWAKGSHLFKFGADYQKVFADTFNDAGIFQTITLGSNSANPTNLSIGATSLVNATQAQLDRANLVYSVVTGLLASTNRTFNVTSPSSGFVPGATRSRVFRQQDLGLYFQDQWRMKPNLTVSLGIRWEFEGVPTIPNGLAIQATSPNSIFGVSGAGNLFNPNAARGVPPAVATLDFVSGNTGKKLYNDDWNNFAPFLGIAWSPSFEKGFLHSIFGSPGRSSVRLGYSISYLRDGFTVISNALGTATTNPGLIATPANNVPTGTLGSLDFPASGQLFLPAPTFTIPITDRANILANSTNGLWAIDPNLKIPYVQQWNVGFEREIFPNTALEVRYVGNHAVKVWRTVDFNEINIFENGFLPEFLRAQSNLAICQANAAACRTAQAASGIPVATTGSNLGQTTNSFQNWGLPGQVPLPIFDIFFRSATAQGFHNNFANTTLVSNLTGNNIGTLASTLAFSPTYRANRECLPGAGTPVCVGVPANFFVANPNAAFARFLTNDSMSNYNSLEVELRRRFAGGLLFQADYTYSKALSDAANAQGNNQADLAAFRTLRNKSLDYRRADFDQTHRFVANALYELPFGKGKSWFSGANGIVNQIVGNWNVGTIVTWATRPPWFVVSNRNTFNNFNPLLNPAQLLGISFDEFKKNVGIYRTPGGIFFINPDLLNITTSATTGRVTSSTLKPGLIGAPAPGSFGNFPMNSLDGPTYFNVDLSVTKRWPVTETVKLELKTTFINVLNHPSFVFANQTFDSTTFGLITTQSGNERIIHFTGSIRF